MNNVVKIPQPGELEQFIEFLYDGLEGYMYVVAKEPENPDSWDQAFFEYPAQVPQVLKAINTYSASHEVYIAPALFKTKDGHKEFVKVTNVLWCDFDGNAPDEFDIPPSLVIRSSEPGHAHTYWKLDIPLSEVSRIDDYNRRLCYKYGADNSGWDANQVLRPPYTTNHKRNGLPVTILSQEDALSFNLAVFDDLAPAPEKNVDYGLWEKIDLPKVNDVIYRNKFGPEFKLIWEKSKTEVEDRSASLTNMAFICAEAGLNDKEIYVIVSHLADRWEKFKHHSPSSRAKQLIGIIEYTRIKYPHTNYDAFDQVFEYSPKTLLETDIQITWAIEGMLMHNGVMLLGGESGIGKSQLSIGFMAHLAMGEDFLNYKIPEPQKIDFFSLEMGDAELKHFIEIMYPIWEQRYPNKIDALNKNLKLIPFGESLPLNSSHGQDVIIDYLEADKPDGVFIDSVGSAILGNISSSETVQAFTNFNDKIRKRYNCFLWYIHHFRKPAPGTKSYGGKEDMFGDQYLTARATSVYTMTRTKGGLIRVRNPKNRHAVEEQPYLIKREEGLHFTYQGVENTDPVSPLDLIVQQAEDLKKPSDPDPTGGFANPNPFGD